MTDTPITASQSRASGMLCPHCKIDLVMADRQGVEIDYCPNCRGVWLDRGELDKIIERSAAYDAPAPAPQATPPHDSYPNKRGRYDQSGYGRRDDCDDRGRRGGRGFLGQLFD
ncbi:MULTISPECIES: TFIIB-type zinc ribbon-containing protein [Alphaproteobacteria]|uniref:TFIIB-type zinc ribbon-containing protein n=1 Tax=Alphaproteobacteria TaxID=28211 RepID=UPI0035588A98